MTFNWLRIAGSAALIAVLALIGVGCSGSSITAPSQNKNISDDPMLAGGPEIGTTPEYPFEFTGRIEKIDQEHNQIVLQEKGMIVRITDKTQARQQFGTRNDFRYDLVAVGVRITVYGVLLKDNSIEAGLVEVLNDTRTTTDMSL